VSVKQSLSPDSESNNANASEENEDGDEFGPTEEEGSLLIKVAPLYLSEIVSPPSGSGGETRVRVKDGAVR
jgi:hypothetical protein